MDANELIDTMHRDMPELMGAVEQATDPALVEAARAKALEAFSETGPWRYAPAAEKAAAAAKVDAELAQQSGEALFRLEHRTEHFKRELIPLIEQAAEPLSVEDAYLAQSQQPGISADRLVALETLDEMRRSRFHVELSPLTPSQLLLRYERALQTPTEQESASLIRFVEDRHRDGWTGVDVGNNAAEAEVMSRLKARIKAAREARIPEWLTVGRIAIEAAEVKAGEVKTLRRIRSVRPANWKAA
jgi:hypothetical protein